MNEYRGDRAPLSRSRRRALALLLSAALLAGCAPKSAVHVMSPLTTQLGRYDTVSLAVSSRIPETEEVMAQFEARLTEKIFERRLFQKLYNESAAPETEVDLRVRCTLIKVESVSKGGRFLLGSWAGVTEFEVLVELTDGASGEGLGVFAAVGMSHGKSILAEGSEIDDAIDRAAEKIVEVMEKNR